MFIGWRVGVGVDEAVGVLVSFGEEVGSREVGNVAAGGEAVSVGTFFTCCVSWISGSSTELKAPQPEKVEARISRNIQDKIERWKLSIVTTKKK